MQKITESKTLCNNQSHYFHPLLAKSAVLYYLHPIFHFPSHTLHHTKLEYPLHYDLQSQKLRCPLRQRSFFYTSGMESGVSPTGKYSTVLLSPCAREKRPSVPSPKAVSPCCSCPIHGNLMHIYHIIFVYKHQIRCLPCGIQHSLCKSTFTKYPIDNVITRI